MAARSAERSLSREGMSRVQVDRLTGCLAIELRLASVVQLLGGYCVWTALPPAELGLTVLMDSSGGRARRMLDDESPICCHG